MLQIQLLHFGTCPRCAPEELQTGFDTGVVREATDRYGIRHRLPAHALGQLCDNGFESDSLHWWAAGCLRWAYHAFILQGMIVLERLQWHGTASGQCQLAE